MEKMDLRFSLTKEQQQLKEAEYQRLIKEPHVLAWLKQNQLPTSFVFEHTGKFGDYLEQIQKCDHCQGLAYCRQKTRGQYMDLYMDNFLSFRIHRCDYLKAEEQELAHRKHYVAMDMPEQQLRIDVSKLDLRKEAKEYKINIRHIIHLMKDKDNKKGLYLWGKPGVGKSYLAAGITNYYTKRKVRCAFVNVPKFIADLKMLFHDNDAMEQKLLSIRNVSVLVLDDIGGESITSWSRDDILLPLLDARMENQKLTYFTSNYSMENLKERFATTANKSSEPMAAERVIERIRTLSSEEFVKGESRRQ